MQQQDMRQGNKEVNARLCNFLTLRVLTVLILQKVDMAHQDGSLQALFSSNNVNWLQMIIVIVEAQ